MTPQIPHPAETYTICERPSHLSLLLGAEPALGHVRRAAAEAHLSNKCQTCRLHSNAILQPPKRLSCTMKRSWLRKTLAHLRLTSTEVDEDM